MKDLNEHIYEELTDDEWQKLAEEYEEISTLIFTENGVQPSGY